MATDLAQQIRDRLDGLAPVSFTFEFPASWTDEQREKFNAEYATARAAVPPAFLDPAEPLSPEDIERWQKEWDELLPEGATVHQIRMLPPGPKVYPGFEQMRDAIIAVLDLHAPTYFGYADGDRYMDQPPDCADCEDPGGVPSAWPCETVRVIAEKLGIEVGDE